MPADGLSALLDVAQQALVRVAADEGFNDPQFEVESGSGARDGFTSTLSRIIVREKDGSKELSLICKTSLDAFGGLMSWLFTTECYMYSTVLPALEDVATLEEPLPWPKCYHAFSDGDKPPYCMVLGDLRPDGFATCPRRDALDAAHCKQVLRQIGRFHGAGLALKHLRPEAFQSMRQWRHIAGNTYDTPEMRTLMAPFQAAIAKCKISEQLAERFPSGDTLAALDKIFSMYAEDLLSVMCPGAEEGSTIIHSDCHTMNVLFQYSGDSVTGCRLIDFQTARYGCPALDLSTMIVATTERATREKHWTDLMQGYHQQLQDTLRAAGVKEPDDVYSWQLFQANLRSAAPYSLVCATISLSIFYGDKRDEHLDRVKEAIEDMNKTDKEVPEVSISLSAAGLQRLGDLIEDLVSYGLMPSVADVEAAANRCAQFRKRQSQKQ